MSFLGGDSVLWTYLAHYGEVCRFLSGMEPITRAFKQSCFTCCPGFQSLSASATLISAENNSAEFTKDYLSGEGDHSHVRKSHALGFSPRETFRPSEPAHKSASSPHKQPVDFSGGNRSFLRWGSFTKEPSAMDRVSGISRTRWRGSGTQRKG